MSFIPDPDWWKTRQRDNIYIPQEPMQIVDVAALQRRVDMLETHIKTMMQRISALEGAGDE